MLRNTIVEAKSSVTDAQFMMVSQGLDFELLKYMAVMDGKRSLNATQSKITNFLSLA